MARKDFTVGLNVQGVGIDDPDVVFYETFSCGSERNYTNYCSAEVEKLFEQQSRMPDNERVTNSCGRSTRSYRKMVPVP